MPTTKKPAHRPLLYGEPTRKVSLTLPISLIEKAKKLGAGNVSRGMVLLTEKKP